MSIVLFILGGIFCTLAAVVLSAFAFAARERYLLWAFCACAGLAAVFWIVVIHAFKKLASM